MVLEIFGYIGSTLIVVSMLMTSIKKLRVINSIGGVISIVYSLLIKAYPVAVMNIALLIINVYSLYKLSKNTKTYEVIHCYKDEKIVEHFLKSNLLDINKFFPDFKLDSKHLDAYMVFSNSLPVGIIVGEKKDSEFNIEIDYTCPSHRDMSVAPFLYNSMKNEVTTLIFDKNSNNHEKYLLDIGFQKSNNAYIKQL